MAFEKVCNFVDYFISFLLIFMDVISFKKETGQEGKERRKISSISSF